MGKELRWMKQIRKGHKKILVRCGQRSRQCRYGTREGVKVHVRRWKREEGHRRNKEDDFRMRKSVEKTIN